MSAPTQPAKSPRKAQPQRKAKKLGRVAFTDSSETVIVPVAGWVPVGESAVECREPVLVLRQADYPLAVEAMAKAAYYSGLLARVPSWSKNSSAQRYYRKVARDQLAALNWHPLPDKEGKK